MKLNLNKKKNRSGSIQINKFRNYTIKTLSEQNNKMAGEIERLNLSVSELSGDNANIKCVLDMKKTSGPRRTKRPRNHQNLLSTKKRFHSHLMHFKYFMWKNQVLAMTKIPKKPIRIVDLACDLVRILDCDFIVELLADPNLDKNIVGSRFLLQIWADRRICIPLFPPPPPPPVYFGVQPCLRAYGVHI
jgi:hypothetical protein